MPAFSDRPSVAIVGTGAIGTSVADALTDAADVVLVRRGNAAAMSIEWNDVRRTVAAAVATRPGDLSAVDWVVVATKAQDTALLGEWLAPLIGATTRVVVVQNGIDHADRVARWVDPSRVIPGVIYLAAEKSGRDLVTRYGPGVLAFPATAIAHEFGALLSTRISVRYTTDFDTEAWSKLILNSALNPLTAIYDRPMEIVHDPAIRPTLFALLDEGIAVAHAANVPFGAEQHAAMLAVIDDLPPMATTSMLLDRRAGRPLEYDYLTGAIIGTAERYGVDVPLLRNIHRMLGDLSAPIALAS